MVMVVPFFLFCLFCFSLSVMYPLGPCEPLRITHYDADFYGSSCQLGRGEVTEPDYLYVAAPNYPFRLTARPCGVCYELTGPEGSVRVMVVSSCPDCDQDMLHFDLSDETFPLLVDQDQGIGLAYVSYREISCDVDGDVKLRWKEDTNLWSFYVVVFNHAVGVETLEIDQGSGWENLVRETWNEFHWSSGGSGELNIPFTLRVTSWYGDSIRLEVDELPSGGEVMPFPRQFEIPRDVSAPYEGECCEPIDIHSDIYDDELHYCWADWSGFVEDMEDPSDPHAGSYSISASFSPWEEFGYGCNAEARVDQYSYLQFWAKTDLETYDGLNIRFSSGKYDELHVAEVPGLTDEWQMFQVAVSSEISFFSFSKVAWKNEDHDPVTLYVDDIELVGDPDAPDLHNCAPGVLGGPADFGDQDGEESADYQSLNGGEVFGVTFGVLSGTACVFSCFFCGVCFAVTLCLVFLAAVLALGVASVSGGVVVVKNKEKIFGEKAGGGGKDVALKDAKKI